MKKVGCYLCGSSQAGVLFKQEGHDPYLAKVHTSVPDYDLNWMVCHECGFVYRSPALTNLELDVLYERYDQDVFSNTTPDDYFDKIISLSNDESENWQKIAWLKEVISGMGRKDIFDALDIHTALNSRNSFGATAPKNVIKACTQARHKYLK